MSEDVLPTCMPGKLLPGQDGVPCFLWVNVFFWYDLSGRCDQGYSDIGMPCRMVTLVGDHLCRYNYDFHPAWNLVKPALLVSKRGAQSQAVCGLIAYFCASIECCTSLFL